MKKAMIFGMSMVLAAGVASAQDGMVMVGQGGSDASEVKVTLEGALVSSHVWRGQVRNNDFVFQPQLTASQYGFSLNIWANYDLGKNYLGVQSDVSEFDFSLAYTLPLDFNEMSFDVGFINYQYPANGAGGGGFGVNNRSTTELFAKATVLSLKDYLIPSVTFFGDFAQADGVYILLDVAVPYQISDYLWVEGGISAGWGNTSYNDYYWGAPLDAGWNDYNFYGTAEYEILDNVTLGLNLTYTMTDGSVITASTPYEADEKFYGGVNVAYDF